MPSRLGGEPPCAVTNPIGSRRIGHDDTFSPIYACQNAEQTRWFLIQGLGFAGLVVIARVPHPIPFRTRP